LAPKFEQSNKSGVTVLETIAQLSLLPLSISVAAMEAVVVAKATVIFLHTADGGVLSSTVTLALQVPTLLAASVTVRVTIFCMPTLEQLKVDWEIVLETTVQLSVLPLSMIPTVTDAVLPDKTTVGLLHNAVGGVVSVTTTNALHMEKFPAASRIVNVIVCGPSLVQSKVVGATVAV
jgi:hypothetical protein